MTFKPADLGRMGVAMVHDRQQQTVDGQAGQQSQRIGDGSSESGHAFGDDEAEDDGAGLAHKAAVDKQGYRIRAAFGLSERGHEHGEDREDGQKAAPDRAKEACASR